MIPKCLARCFFTVGALLLLLSPPRLAGGVEAITNSIGMKLVLVPAGEFMMGSGESAESTAAFFSQNYRMTLTADYCRKEHPQHPVRITRPFYLGAHHVTRGQFRAFVEQSGYKTEAEKGDKPGADGWNAAEKKFQFHAGYSWQNVGFEQTEEHPVLCVSWNDAVAFCRWLDGKEGKQYRLPTEAEWEYACRAGTTTRYSSGDDPETLAQAANVPDATSKAYFPRKGISGSDGYAFTSPAGSFRPNAFGLYDMHGNAWQWCADWQGKDYYAASPLTDPKGPDSGLSRVLRGGSWHSGPSENRSANRGGAAPSIRASMGGFRVACTP